MKYRKFGRLDWKVSALGFGALRLPVVGKDQDNILHDAPYINEPEAIRMMHYAFDHGVNYVDSSYRYNLGASEVAIGKALQDGYREKVKVATKLPCVDINSSADFDRCLNEQLKRLQTDSIDFYLLHGLDKVEWPKLRKLGVLKWAEDAMAHGRFHYFGFSFHDTYDVFQEIVDSYDNWTICQIQYNYMDEEFQAGTRGLEYAHKKGLAVVVMEPIKGGRLTRPPEKVVKIWASSPVKRTPSEWALRWVWNHPEVTSVLSGMSTLEQVVENVATADHSEPHNLTTDDLALIGQARDAYRSLKQISCTACRYCMPCPNGVDIPRVFDYYNQGIIYSDVARVRMVYGDPKLFREETRGDKCITCEQCVEKCPQKLAIPELLEKAHAFLTEKD